MCGTVKEVQRTEFLRLSLFLSIAHQSLAAPHPLVAAGRKTRLDNTWDSISGRCHAVLKAWGAQVDKTDTVRPRGADHPVVEANITYTTGNDYFIVSTI